MAADTMALFDLDVAPATTRTGPPVLDLFAGVGWSVAAGHLGLAEDGVEINPAAQASRAAAGFATPWPDVWDPVDDLNLRLRAGTYEGLIGSPPCQTFSQAGKGSGRKALDDVMAALREQWWTDLGRLRELGAAVGDERTALVLTPLTYAHQLMPKWIALEQVPAVLPVWEAIGEVLRTYGYHVWVGMVHAEQHCVPQTRKRAILMAHADHPVNPPAPAHSRYHSRTPSRLDPGLDRWVSMAEALGWGMTARPYPTIACSRSTGGPDKEKVGGSAARAAIYAERAAGRWVHDDAGCAHDGRPCPGEATTPAAGWALRNNSSANAAERHAHEPAPTIYCGERSNYCAWEWIGDDPLEPGPAGTDITHRAVHPGETPRTIDRDQLAALVRERANDQTGTPYDPTRPTDRPAMTVAGRGLVPHPGPNANRFNASTKSRNDGIRITVAEAAVLQGFDPDFPFQGTASQRFQQIGNAVPPPMAHAILAELVD